MDAINKVSKVIYKMTTLMDITECNLDFMSALFNCGEFVSNNIQGLAHCKINLTTKISLLHKNILLNNCKV